MVPWLDAAYLVNAERVLLLYVQVRHNHPKTTVSDIKAARMEYYENGLGTIALKASENHSRKREHEW